MGMDVQSKEFYHVPFTFAHLSSLSVFLATDVFIYEQNLCCLFRMLRSTENVVYFDNLIIFFFFFF